MDNGLDKLWSVSVDDCKYNTTKIKSFWAFEIFFIYNIILVYILHIDMRSGHQAGQVGSLQVIR